MSRDYLNPYLSGVLLGLVLLVTNFVSGRGLGASGAYRSALSAAAQVVSPQRATANPFNAHTPAEASPRTST